MNEQAFLGMLLAQFGVIPHVMGKGVAPVLAKENSWYKGTTDKGTITSIRMVGSYTPTGNENEFWFADENGDGSITCYVVGTELIIAGNGSRSIMANADSGYAFSGFNAVTTIDGLILLDTSRVTNMHCMFWALSSLISIDLSKFDTSNVTDMRAMFSNCTSLIGIDVTKFDTSKVTSMASMFSYCYAFTTLDLRKFNTSNVTDISEMFRSCNKLNLLDLTSFDTRNVDDAYRLFGYSGALQKILVSDTWDLSNASDTRDVFYKCGCSSVTYI